MTLKERIRDARYAIVDLITHTYDVSVNGIVDHRIDTHIKTAVNAALEEAAQVAENEPKVWDIDAPRPQQRIATKIRALKEGK